VIPSRVCDLRYGSTIIGTGRYAPARVLTNDDLSRMVETTDAWIQARTGVRERRMVSEWENSGTMALEASRQALAKARLEPEQLDLIIVATCSPEKALPSTACLLQQRLGAAVRTGAAFDLAAACSGFLFALTTAHAHMQLGHVEHALVVGVDTLSRMTDYSQRSTAILFGDGAGAIVLKRSDLANNGILYTRLFSDGTGHGLIHAPGSLNPTPTSKEKGRDGKEYCIRMDGPRVFRLAVTRMQELIEDALEATGLLPQEINLLIPHQANLRIIEAVSEKTNFPKDRVFVNVERFGNTSSASIPIAFDEALSTRRLTPGDLALMVSFGAGLTWGSVLVRA
jgi:3-oxoacyl-[acyl-carrier-protein] synthase III